MIAFGRRRPGLREFLRSARFHDLKLNLQRSGCSLEQFEFLRVLRHCRIAEHCHPFEAGHRLLQQLQLLAAQLRSHEGHPGDFPRGPSQTGDEPARDRIAVVRHHDRNRLCRAPGLVGRGLYPGDDHIDPQPCQLGRKGRQLFDAVAVEAALEGDVPAFDVAEFA